MKTEKSPELATYEKVEVSEANSEPLKESNITERDPSGTEEEDIHKGEPGLLHKLMRKKKIRGKMARNRLFIEGVKCCFSCYEELKKE